MRFWMQKLMQMQNLAWNLFLHSLEVVIVIVIIIAVITVATGIAMVTTPIPGGGTVSGTSWGAVCMM